GFLAAALGGVAWILWGENAGSGVVCLATCAGLVLSGAIVALRGAFASREHLRAMSGWIGTENPVAARIVCWVALAVILALAVLAGLLACSEGLRRSFGISR